MQITDEQKWKKLNRIVAVIPKSYIEALLAFNEKLEGKKLKWIVNGDLAEALKAVQTNPQCIEIICTKQDAEQIFEQIKDFNSQPISFQTQTLPRNAVVNGSQYLIYVRSHFFKFYIKGIEFKVFGDLQYKVGNWEWGDIFAFDPDYVYVVGKKIAVTPLAIAYEIYCNLGWANKAEKIKHLA